MVYSEVVKNNLILDKKSKYTKVDYNNLIKKGITPNAARFICICSAIYYDVTYSKFFESLECKIECKII